MSAAATTTRRVAPKRKLSKTATPRLRPWHWIKRCAVKATSQESKKRYHPVLPQQADLGSHFERQFCGTPEDLERAALSAKEATGNRRSRRLSQISEKHNPRISLSLQARCREPTPSRFLFPRRGGPDRCRPWPRMRGPRGCSIQIAHHGLFEFSSVPSPVAPGDQQDRPLPAQASHDFLGAPLRASAWVPTGQSC